MTPAVRLDVRLVACPLSWVRTRIALERLAAGEALEVLLAEGEALESVPRSAELEGHRVDSQEPWPGGGFRVLIVKADSRSRTPPTWEA